MVTLNTSHYFHKSAPANARFGWWGPKNDRDERIKNGGRGEIEGVEFDQRTGEARPYVTGQSDEHRAGMQREIDRTIRDYTRPRINLGYIGASAIAGLLAVLGAVSYNPQPRTSPSNSMGVTRELSAKHPSQTGVYTATGNTVNGKTEYAVTGIIRKREALSSDNLDTYRIENPTSTIVLMRAPQDRDLKAQLDAAAAAGTRVTVTGVDGQLTGAPSGVFGLQVTGVR